ncbi:ABC transporter permease [Porcincola intestinalis]|uniref:ABC transporter permease n=1 Tax=Porcincola intestinalis TaxID=2606632 RepID=A0A6L5X515_9FIRM|nr:ABC transporter permease [Porcincola intestinalis]MSS14557.1 ABC transporter permease [Porcincola intestinalis]
MMNTIRQVFRSAKFVTGFVIFIAIILLTILFPLFITYDPLDVVGNGNFYPPGTYISQKDTIKANPYELRIALKQSNVGDSLKTDELDKIKEWLTQYGGMGKSEVQDADAESLIVMWTDKYNPSKRFRGMLASEQKYYKRLNQKLTELLTDKDIIIAEQDENNELKEKSKVKSSDFVNLKEISNKRTLVLGTDNFGRDVLRELVSATTTSLRIGLIAGVVATAIGLTLGLLAGYLGGFIDDLILFITNLFTVIPSFVLLILISYSVGQKQRGVGLVALIIGITSWTWTTRAVRSQVISLRNRDHVNLSKLSGHSSFKIIMTDILPYIASYVVMAFILQVSSGILSEAQLSMLGLGPATTSTATLGLMMNWAMLYSAHLNGSWWAYFPVLFMIAMISFSLNLMNTGLDQVFNPQLRD